MKTYILSLIILIILILVYVYYYAYKENFENINDSNIKEIEIAAYNNNITDLSNSISNKPNENLLLKTSRLNGVKFNFDNISDLNENIMNINHNLQLDYINGLFTKIKGNVDELNNFNLIKKYDTGNQTLI